MEGLRPVESPPGRCTSCRAFILLSVAAGNAYEHYPTLATLETSANNGCDFCGLLWHCIRTGNSETAVATVMKKENQQITIKANSTNMKIMPALDNYSAFDELLVNVGKEGGPEQSIWARIELFTFRGKILLNFQNLTLGGD
jgi:hypothetical protein